MVITVLWHGALNVRAETTRGKYGLSMFGQAIKNIPLQQCTLCVVHMGSHRMFDGIPSRVHMGSRRIQ